MIDYLNAATDFLAQQAPGSKNPFDGVVPDFNVFGLQFTQAWQKLLAGIWGIAFVIAAFGAIRAVGVGGGGRCWSTTTPRRAATRPASTSTPRAPRGRGSRWPAWPP
jgi:hypothetical protein